MIASSSFLRLRAWTSVLFLALLEGCAADSFDDAPIGRARSPLVWSAEQELKQAVSPPQGEFGSPVAISGDTAIVGAHAWEGTGKSYQGAAFVFVRTPSGWTQQAMLTSADAKFFGSSVAISGDTAVVGAIGGLGSSGNAYIFHRSGSEWTLQAALTGTETHSEFGYSASVSGDTVVIGSPYNNKAFIYSRSAANWSLQTVLSAPNPTDVYYGISVAVSGNTCLVGEQHSGSGGRVFVFDRTGDGWSQSAILSGDNAAANEVVGGIVAYDSDTAILSGVFRPTDADSAVPAAFVFVRKDGSWQQEAILTGAGGDSTAFFGGDVALSGDVAIVASGSHADDAPPYTKVAYLFRRTSGVWVQEGIFERAAPSGYDLRSTSVGVSGNAAVVGVALSRRCKPGDDTCLGVAENDGAFVLEAIDKRTPVPDATAPDAAIAPDSGEPDASRSSPQNTSFEAVGGCEASGRGTSTSPLLVLLLLPYCVWAWRRRRIGLNRSGGDPNAFFAGEAALSGDVAVVAAGSHAETRARPWAAQTSSRAASLRRQTNRHCGRVHLGLASARDPVQGVLP